MLYIGLYRILFVEVDFTIYRILKTRVKILRGLCLPLFYSSLAHTFCGHLANRKGNSCCRQFQHQVFGALGLRHLGFDFWTVDFSVIVESVSRLWKLACHHQLCRTARDRQGDARKERRVVQLPRLPSVFLHKIRHQESLTGNTIVGKVFSVFVRLSTSA